MRSFLHGLVVGRQEGEFPFVCLKKHHALSSLCFKSVQSVYMSICLSIGLCLPLAVCAKCARCCARPDCTDASMRSQSQASRSEQWTRARMARCLGEIIIIWQGLRSSSSSSSSSSPCAACACAAASQQHLPLRRESFVTSASHSNARTRMWRC